MTEDKDDFKAMIYEIKVLIFDLETKEKIGTIPTFML